MMVFVFQWLEELRRSEDSGLRTENGRFWFCDLCDFWRLMKFQGSEEQAGCLRYEGFDLRLSALSAIKGRVI